MPRKADQRLEGRIVDAAYQLWSQGGEPALTMRAVARAAKTTTPTLYERFKDKHDLLTFLRARARQRMFQAVKGAKTATEVCELGLEFMLANGNEFRLLVSDWAIRLDRKENLPSFDFLKKKLAEDLGGSPEDHQDLALSLVALINGTAFMVANEGLNKELLANLETACREGVRRLIGAERKEAGSEEQPAKLGQELEGPREARADADGAEIATISRQHSIDTTALGEGSNGVIDQAEAEFLEFGVKFEGANEVGRQ